MDYAALKTELDTDPHQLGYAPYVASGADNQLAALLNAPRASEACSVGVVATKDAFLLFDPAEWAALPDAYRQWFLQLGGDGVLDFGNPQLVQRIQSVLQANGCPNSLQAMNEGLTRAASRAEALFGAGTLVRHEDVGVALRGGVA